MKHKKTSFAILFGLLSLSLAVSGSATWIITSPTINGGPSNIRKDNSVCYIYETDYYYSSLEGAIKDANAYVGGDPDNATIIVIPNKTVYINNDTTLQSGVDLLMPYNKADGTMTEIEKENNSDSTSGKQLYRAKYMYASTSGSESDTSSPTGEYLENGESGTYYTDNNFVDYSNTNIDKYLSSTMVVKPNVTLTIKENSQLVVYGQLGRAAGTGLMGNTSGYYSQIIMCDNSKIIVEEGAILDVRGYIKEAWDHSPALEELDNHGSLIENSGTIYIPFVIYDYGGGSRTVALYFANECPFSMYDMPNIQIRVKTSQAGNILGRADLFTSYQNPDNLDWIVVNVQHNTCLINLLGTNNNSLLILNNTSVARTKYYPNSFYLDKSGYYCGLTQNISKTDSNNIKGRTKISVNNFVSPGTFKINIGVFGQNVNLDITRIDFPIPWNFDIEFNNISSTLNFNSYYKFLPGSKLTLKNCSNVSVSGKLIFLKTNWTDSAPSDYLHPNLNNSNLIIQNSSINLNSGSYFGGDVILNADETSASQLSAKMFNNAATNDSVGGNYSTSKLIGMVSDLLAFIDGNKNFEQIRTQLSEAFYVDSTNSYPIQGRLPISNPENLQAINTYTTYYSDPGNLFFNDGIEDIPNVENVNFTLSIKDESGQTYTSGSNLNLANKGTIIVSVENISFEVDGIQFNDITSAINYGISLEFTYAKEATVPSLLGGVALDLDSVSINKNNGAMSFTVIEGTYSLLGSKTRTSYTLTCTASWKNASGTTQSYSQSVQFRNY